MVSYSHLLTFENYQEISENGPNFSSRLQVKKPESFQLKDGFSFWGNSTLKDKQD